MNFKQGMVLVGAVLAVTGCGGGSDNTKEPHAPYVEFRVNGALEPNQVSVNWLESTVGGDIDLCDLDNFENAQAVIDNEPGYCNQSYSPSITFSARFTNSSYEALDVSFKGLGMEVHIFEYDELASDFKGTEIWNSNYYRQRAIVGTRDIDPDVELEDFDPDSVTTLVLDASDTIPSYSASSSISVAFNAFQIFPDGLGDYRSFSLAEIEANLRASSYPQTQSCDYFLQTGEVDTTKARYVQCLGAELLPEPGTIDPEPVKFVATVTFSFNDWADQPDDIIITVNPPE